MTVQELNQRYGARGRISFQEGFDGAVIISLVSRYGACELSLYGAHILSYRPVGHGPVLFLSKKSAWQKGLSIRGGIPVCWPWFGAVDESPDLPRHGFARIQDWTVVASEYTNDYTELTLGLKDSEESRALWPWKFELKYTIRVGESLRVALTTGNVDERPMEISEGFHPYFRIREIETVSVDRLDGARGVDCLSGEERKQTGMFSFAGETDRILYPKANGCTLVDSGLGRGITVTFQGTRSLVLWNPGKDKVMADVEEGEYRQFACVEPANTKRDRVAIPPGKTHTLSMEIQCRS